MLHRACRSGDLNQIAQALNTNMSIINDKDSGLGWTALYRAVICDQLEVCETLLKNGADPNIPNNLGQIPIHSAAESSQLSIAELLLNNKSDVNCQSTSGDTPLHYASMKGDYKMAKLLLEHNALPNTPNTQGKTPLHNAVESSSVECVKVLREHGADPEIYDKKHKRPLDIATDARLSEVLLECKAIYLTSKSEDFSEIENSPHMYELFNTFGGNLQSVLKESKRPEKPILMDWLNNVNLPDLYGLLVDSGYDDHVVMARQMVSAMPITEANLREIGIDKPGTRKKLLFYLDEEGRRKNCKKDPMIGVSVSTIRDWLDDISLGDYYENFIKAGYDDYTALVKMVPTKWGLCEESLRKDLCIFNHEDSTKILSKLQRDFLFSRNDGSILYEEPKSIACGKCIII